MLNAPAIEALLDGDPFTGESKRSILLRLLNELTIHHREHCVEYSRVIKGVYQDRVDAQAIEDVPYLPVGVFKRMELRSVPAGDVHRVLRSSGTTSDQTSRIILDRSTAALQGRALSRILTHLLGRQRRPMLIVDSPDVLTGSGDFTARTTAVLGMMPFGRDPRYAFDRNLQADVAAVMDWLSTRDQRGGFVFGFTFLMWKLAQALPLSQRPVENGILLHGGGWKKLQDLAVARDEFNRVVAERLGIARVHNYYGLVEQVGSIFIECEAGFFHTPVFADVVVRRPTDWQAAGHGERGVLQVLSAVPWSYPGHSILTEDEATVFGVDDCTCGRLGTRFLVHGRLPQTVARGCSDTRNVA